MNEEDGVSESEMLRAEIQALRQSVWHIEQIASSQQGEIQNRRGKPPAVTVANVNISFWAMVTLLVTAAIAAIPALIILLIISALLWSTALAIIAGLAI